jgi:hypothetical protein
MSSGRRQFGKMVIMSIRAVLFDIGGVLEVTPPTGWQQAWCDRLGIDGQEMLQRLGPIWRCGEVGKLSIEAIECLTAEAWISTVPDGNPQQQFRRSP